MPEVTVRVQGLKKTLGNIRKFREGMFKEFSDLVNRSALAIDRGAKRRVVVDTGRLRSSISPRILKSSGASTAYEVAARTNYAAFVEFGTSRVGAATNKQRLPDGYRHGSTHKMPPDGALRGWVRRVIRPDSDGLDEAEFAVAFGIASRPGLPARPFLGPAFEAERPHFIRGVEKAFKAAVRRVP